MWTKIQQERRIGAANIVRMAIERGGIRSGLDPELAADVVWVLNDPGLYVRFVGERGWAPDAYRDWLAATLRGAAARMNSREPRRRPMTPVR